MKRSISLFLALTMLFSLTACGKQPTEDEIVCSFFVLSELYEQEYKAEDGTTLAQCHYELADLEITHDLAANVQMFAAQQTFNAEMERQQEEQISFFGDLCDAAREDYAYMSENGLDWNAYEDEMTIGSTYQTDGGLLSIYAAAYCYTGGAHPNNGFATWNYDLNEGKFLQYSDFTDDEETFRAVVANEILSQIDEQGFAEGLFEGYKTSVEELSHADVCFNADGMTVCFPEYILGPHAAGLPSFIVPYEKISGAMNDYGRALLNL